MEQDKKTNSFILNFWIWLKQTIFAIGLITIICFIKLNFIGSLAFNPDLFKDKEQILKEQAAIDRFEELEILAREQDARSELANKKQ